MMTVGANACFNVDDYINYVEEEPPLPLIPETPVDPNIIPEQGGTQQPSGSGGIQPGGESTEPDIEGGSEVVIPETLAITSVSPSFGDVRGGYEVRLKGSLLEKSGTVRFGNVTSPLQTYVSGSVVRVIVPAGKPGCVDVIWKQDDAEITIENGFCYRENVALDAVEPPVVVAGQATPILIRGQGFDDKTRAYFKSNALSLPLADSQVNDSEMLTGAFPDFEPGVIDLVVTNAVSGAVMSHAVQVLPALELLRAEPSVVKVGNGQTIKLNGSGFDSGVSVRIGSSVIVPQVESESELSFVAPDLPAGEYEVLVYDKWRQKRSAFKLYYVLNESASEVLSVNPSFGKTQGGDTVSICGMHLPTAGNASFGNALATSEAQNADCWQVKTAPANAGFVDVVLDTLRLSDGYEYIDYPELTAVEPSHGDIGESHKVTLTGNHFTEDLRVKFGPWEAGQVTVIDSTKAEVMVPAGSGSVPIELLQGRADVPTDLIYTYDDTVEITGIAPDQSVIPGNMPVYLYGSGFTQDMTLLVDGTEVNYYYISGNMVFFDSPSHAAGDVSVVLKCGDEICASTKLTYYNPSGINSSAAGGDIHGQVHVTVLTVNTSVPIPGATVFIGSNRETALQGKTDINGRVSFYDSSLNGDQIVVACAPEHSCNTLQPLNASNITLFLEDWHAEDGDSEDPSEPPPPPPPPSDFDVNPVDITVPYTPIPSYLVGKVSSFGKVELASDPDVVKAGIVIQSMLGAYSPSYDKNDIYYLFEEGSRYRILARNGEVAVALVCGLHNVKTGEFTPKFIGLVRHIMVTDGLTIENDLSCPIPLNQTQPIKLIDAPLNSGPNVVVSNSYISLGNEGYIGGFLKNHSYTDLVVASQLPQLRGVLEDATMAHIVGAYTSNLLDNGQLQYYYPATVFYSYNNPITSSVIEVGPAAPIPQFLTTDSEDILETGTISWKVEYPKNVDFYQLTVTMYSSAGRRLLYQFYLPGSATSAEFPTWQTWPDDNSGQLYIQLTAYKSIRSGFDFNLFSTAELRYNYIHSSASETLVINQWQLNAEPEPEPEPES